MQAYPAYPDTGEANERPDQFKANHGREISSESLFRFGRNEVVIEHRGEEYRLRQTRNGKLILTK
ncbi:MAG TPA: hemin uptake protein HemP [Thiobacillaceae bacterium]|nr:hemin uptake protein HemP [Thiobacillaceae bacterium]